MWGGKRKGAGRKPIRPDKRRVGVKLSIDPDTLKAIDVFRGDRSRGAYIDLLVKISNLARVCGSPSFTKSVLKKTKL